MVILGDLIANHEQQHFTSHIGTRPGDFRQLYTGKLLLNGSLRLKVASINAANITLMGQSVTSKPYDQYLLRTERQVGVGNYYPFEIMLLSTTEGLSEK